jgi:flagellar biosynthesis protein FliR
MTISIAQTQMFLLALTRIMAILIQVPVLGGQTIPTQVRVGLGLILAALLMPWQLLPTSAEALPLLGLVMAIGRELLIGILAGFAASLTFNMLQIAGEMMALGSGFGAGRILNPTLGDSGSAMDQLFVMVAMLIFLVLNGHHSVILAVQRTFVVLPINHPLPEFTAGVLITTTAQLIAAGVQIALPVVGALLMTDITLGLLARVAPQIQVFFLGLPLKIAIGMFALGLVMSISMPFVSEIFASLGGRMLKMLGG